MLNLFKKNNAPKIQITCSDSSIKINGEEITFPTHLNTLISFFGEPSRREHKLLWRAIWDDIGIYVEYGTWDNILFIYFLCSNHHQKEIYPKHYFKGEITVDGKTINANTFQEIDLTKNVVRTLIYKGESQPYAISIGTNSNYKEEIPKDKYTIQPLDEEVIEFTDFGFKVSIIQELMYRKELLKPKFDLHEFADWYDKRDIDLEEEGYDPIPEVTQYFKDLPIPKRFAKEVTEIYQDGGNDIYMQLIRFNEGYEDNWDIENAEDAKQFPNLKKAILCYAKPNVLNDLQAMGIDAEWI